MTDYTKLTDFASKDTLPTGNAAKIVKGTEIDDEFEAIETAIATKADLNSPILIGTPAAPTASAATDTTQIATTAFVQDAILQTGIIDTAQLTDDAVTADKLADTAVTADTYGDASNIPQITVDAQGRITDATTVEIYPQTYSFAVDADTGGTQDFYLTAGTWQIIHLFTVKQVSGDGTYSLVTSQRTASINSTDATANVKFSRTGGSGFGRYVHGSDIAVATTTITTAGTFTLTIGTPSGMSAKHDSGGSMVTLQKLS